MNYQTLVRNYRSRQNASLRAFASALSENSLESISYQSVKNWEDGIHTPNPMYLLSLALRFSDWRRNFALDALAILKPELYKPDSILPETEVK